MRKPYFSISMIAMTTIAAWGQHTQEILNQNNLKNWQSGISDMDPRALAALGDGRVVYFEDDSSFPSWAEDAVILINPEESDQNGRFLVIGSESTLLSLGGSGSCCIYVSDLALDENGQLYAMVSDYATSNQSAENYIVRFPKSANGFGAPENFSDFLDGGLDDGKIFHRLAVNGGQVFAAFDDRVGGSQNGIYVQNDSGSNGSLSDFQLLASHEDLSPAAFGNVAPNAVYQIAAMVADHQDGVLLVIHEMEPNGNGFSEKRGAILRVRGNGTIQVVLSPEEAAKQTGVPNTFSAFTCLAVDRNNGTFYTFETGTAGNREQIWQFDANGKFQGQVGGYYQTIDAGSQVSTSLQSGHANALALGGQDLFYWSADNASGNEALFRVDLTASHQQALTWPHGVDFNDDVSCHFGPRQLFTGGYRHDFHRGIDMEMPTGSTLFASADGIVDQILVDDDGQGNFEYGLRIRHHTGGWAPTLYSWYNHLSQVLVSIDEVVQEGDPVAESGKPLNSGFEHLHFGVRRFNGGPEFAVNPLTYLPYVDTPPLTPTYLNGSADHQQQLAFVEIAADDESLDLAGIILEVDGTATYWNWADANRQNGLYADEKLDKPIVHLENGLVIGVFPEWMNAGQDQSRLKLAVAGIPANAGHAFFTIQDVHEAETTIALQQPNNPIACPSVFATLQVQPNQTAQIAYSLTNQSNQAVNLHLDAVSAMKLPISIQGSSDVFLAPGEHAVITVLLDMNGDSGSLGDAILLQGFVNNQPVLTCLRELVTTP